ncbi:hypothetical protein SDC9_136220 [bioreactor metagenome]|uniref:Uncharacterized protein n=1 Tax=bioreactor metagenome TaxID=1076179 RepID=A0A645DKM7_9ZZZZ
MTAALLNDNINQKLVRKASISFGISLLMLTFIIGLASVIAFLADLTLPLIGLCLLSGGYVAAKITGLKHRDLLRVILKSFLGIAPGIVLILLAMSVKFIISNGGIMDTILYYTANTMLGTSPYLAVLLIYGLILMLELFVGSSSAKAFLVMPLIAPLADLIGVTRQTAVLAFCFGDGFSNVIYPTNPVLLICLGLTVVSFPKWFKWTYKLQLCALIMACIFLFIGVAISYGPF